MDGVETWISKSWLPDEVVNIDTLPSTLSIPRRHALRYLRVEILATSPKYQVSFSNVSCDCVSAIAQTRESEAPRFSSKTLRLIDRVSIFTLRDCMQEVFEDGPRRDRRPWLGNLRLQALAKLCHFQRLQFGQTMHLAVRCHASPRWVYPGLHFDCPEIVPSTDYIVDYDALFAVVVNDYVEASGDISLGEALYPTVLGCLKRPLSHFLNDAYTLEASSAPRFKILDWHPNLHRDAGCHGLLLYCLGAANHLASTLQKPPPFEQEVLRMMQAAYTFLDSAGTLVSGPEQ